MCIYKQVCVYHLCGINVDYAGTQATVDDHFWSYNSGRLPISPGIGRHVANIFVSRSFDASRVAWWTFARTVVVYTKIGISSTILPIVRKIWRSSVHKVLLFVITEENHRIYVLSYRHIVTSLIHLSKLPEIRTIESCSYNTTP